MREDSDYEVNDMDDETYTINSKHKKKKLVKKLNNESESDLNIEIKKNHEIKNDPNFSKNKYHKLLIDKITNDNLSHPCYFCNQIFIGDNKIKYKP